MPDLDRILTGHMRPRPPETPTQARMALDADDRSSWKCARPGCPSSSVRLTRYGYHHINSYSVPYGLDHPPVPVRPSRFQPLSEVEEDAHQADRERYSRRPCWACGSPNHAFALCRAEDPAGESVPLRMLVGEGT